MKYLPCIFSLLVLLFCNSIHAQVAPSIEWEKSTGGSGYENAHSVQQTTDGGFVVAGTATSINYGGDDCYVVKLDASGNLGWQYYWGGSLHDGAYSIQQIADGGFIMAGSSHSNDGNVSGNHGGDDYWIVKMNATGYLVWQKSLGGSKTDIAYSIRQTSDGGFIVAGYSASNDYNISENHGGYDYWIVKLGITGNLLWQKSLGGTGDDEATCIQQTTDGGYIVAGWSKSNDGDVSANYGLKDCWIVKLDTTGNIAWQNHYGGSSFDYANSIKQTTDGGFIIAGASYSDDHDVSGYQGSGDEWVIKTDASGNLLWQKCLGGSSVDLGQSVQQTTDGGFIVAGSSWSIDGDVSGNHGFTDSWIVKLNTGGNIVWQKCFGGSNVEEANSIQQAADGGFIFAGSSASNNGEVFENHGGDDYWIVKLTSDSTTGILSVPTNSISISPNPVQTQLIINLSKPMNPDSAGTICVYDLQGRMIALPTTFTNTQAQLNTEKLPHGFYTLQIINNKTGEHLVAKFVKGE